MYNNFKRRPDSLGNRRTSSERRRVRLRFALLTNRSLKSGNDALNNKEEELCGLMLGIGYTERTRWKALKDYLSDSH